MLKKITENVEIHQTLPDTPNLTSEELKKEWDKGSKIIKEKFNELIDLLNDAEVLESKEKIEGTILYEDGTGTNGAVTFNEKIQEGDSIEIVYCRRKTDGSSIYKVTGKIPFIEGMETDLDINYFSVPDNQQSISKSITINNDGITVNGENTWGNANGFNNATSTIYILKVKKY